MARVHFDQLPQVLQEKYKQDEVKSIRAVLKDARVAYIVYVKGWDSKDVWEWDSHDNVWKYRIVYD